MRRLYGLATLLVLSLLLALIAVGTARSAAPTSSPAGSGAAVVSLNSASSAAAGNGYKRKLPPPPRSTQPGPQPPAQQPQACSTSVTDISHMSGNESESSIVINPTNANNIVAFSNLDTASSIFRAYTNDGGATWTTGTVATNVACCDGQATFDQYGNLFLVYINGGVNQINVITSVDGGATFSAPLTVGTGSVDQPSIAVGNGSLWVDWNSSGNMVARGAPVTGLGGLGAFNALQTIPSAAGSFGGIAVGPGPNGGKVMVTYQNPTGGEGPATIYVNVDADGLGSGGFGPQIMATTTNVGGFDFIPAQSGRSIDAEAGLVWDSTGGVYNNRAYLVYTEEIVNESNDTDIYVRTSTDDGATWSAPVRVNDDATNRSQFLPYIGLDKTSGTVAVGWHDARNDTGVPGVGGTNNIPNDDAQYFASYSVNGGAAWAANTQLSGGFSNAADANNGIDYGDYVGTNAYGGKLVAAWADNSNCGGTNPNGTLHQFDLYFNSLPIGSVITGTATSTVTGTPPTATNTRTATPTASPTTCSNFYTVVTTTGSLIPGTVDTGNHGDDVATTINLPFSVQLYGQTYTSAQVGSNGTLSFGTLDNAFTNACLPEAMQTYQINPYWDDQETTASLPGCTAFANGCGVFTATVGSTLYIDYHTVLFSSTSTPLEYEVALTQGSSNFSIIYGPNITDSASETVGVQKDNTSTYTSYKCNTASPALTAGLRLNFNYTTCSTTTGTPSASAVASSTGTTAGTSTSSATVTVAATGTPSATATTGIIPTITIIPTISPTPPAASATASSVATGQASMTATTQPGASSTSTTQPGASMTATVQPGASSTTTVQPVASATSTSTVQPTACPLQFTDVPSMGSGSTFYTFVRCLVCRGVVSGYPCGGVNPATGQSEPCDANQDGYYRPGNNVSRGQLSKIIANSAGLNSPIPTGQQSFSDVPPSSSPSSFYVYIERLASTGAIAGYPCNTTNPQTGQFLPCDNASHPYFLPTNNATRGQISKIVALTAGYQDILPSGQQTFTDVPPNSPFYQYIEELASRHIIDGYDAASGRCSAHNPPYSAPCFLYNDFTTRGQMAKIAANAFYPNCQTPTEAAKR